MLYQSLAIKYQLVLKTKQYPIEPSKLLQAGTRTTVHHEAVSTPLNKEERQVPGQPNETTRDNGFKFILDDVQPLSLQY